MLIDNYLPKYDQRVRHQTRVAAATAEAYAALRAVDVHRSVVVRLLLAIRRLPSRVGVREHPPSHVKSVHSLLDSMLDLGWEILEETPGREVVIGTVTQPWRSTVQFRGLMPREFVAFAEPGFAKIVMNLAAEDCAEGGCLVSTETRVLATSPGARRRFRLYWRVVSPGVRIIRRIALTRVCRELRRAQKRRRKSSKLILN